DGTVLRSHAEFQAFYVQLGGWFLCSLKEVTLSYRLPSDYLKGLFIRSASAYISGTNLLTWSKYSGYDPEVNSSTNPFVSGVDNGSFPKSRSYNLGVRVQF